ncbi:MAG: peptide ABC transporter substrate-binding protein [Armatimonadota bacterium]
MRITVSAVGVLLALGLWPGATGEAAPAFRKDLILGSIQEPSSRNPFTATAATEVLFLPLFIPYANQRNDRLELINEYIEAVPTLANGMWKVSADGKMEVTWKLRRDLKWQDGKPLTSEDFKFAWDIYKDPKAPLGARNLDAFDAVTFPDAYTMVVKYKSPWVRAAVNWLGTVPAPLPKHVVEPMIRRVGIERFNEIPYGTDPGVTVGAGPFILKSWLRGNEMVFEANPKYHLGRPVLDRIVFRFFSDVNVMVANFAAGRLDAASPAPGGIPIPQALEIEDMLRSGRLSGYRVEYYEAPASEGYWFNHENPIFRDRRVRQALLHATDREGIAQAIFRSKVSVAHSYFPPSHKAYNPNIKKYPFDPARARTLLDEAGWRPSPDGIRRNAAGARLSLVITAPAGDRTRERVEQIVQDGWRDVGVELVIDNKPVRAILGEIWLTGRRPPDILNFSHPIDDFSDIDSWWASWNAPAVGQRGSNHSRYRNEEWDKFIREYNNTMDGRKRREMHKRFQEMWGEEAPILLLYNYVGAAVIRDGLAGFRPLGLSYTPGYFTWNARTWRWTR